MVGLATAVLIGAALIVIGKVLPHDGTANASPSTSATADSATGKATPKPRPTATPRPLATVTLLPGTPPVPTPQPAQFGGWFRAKVDLPVKSDASDTSLTIATIRAGDLGNMGPAEASGWFPLSDPASGGMIHLAGNQAGTVEWITPPPTISSGYVSWLLATAHGFVAEASSPATASHLIVSRDGSHWTAEPAAVPGVDVPWLPYAFGPAGWMAYTVDDQSGSGIPERPVTTWLWSSPDAVHWKVLGAWVDPTNLGRYPDQLTGTARGYVLTMPDYRYGGATGTWFSADGVTWNETAYPGFGAGRNRQVIGTDAGFFAWDESGDYTSPVLNAAFSADGRTWTAVDRGPDGSSLQLAALGDRLLALDRDRVSGSARAWIGSVRRRGFSWRRDLAADQAFEGAVVTVVVSDGNRVTAFGWERGSEASLVWTGDGQHWRRSVLPEAFGGIPHQAAAGPAGVVAVGYRANARGPNPVIWHESPTGSWAPEPSPVLAMAPNPTSGDCPARPTDALGFILLDVAAAPACFGNSPITLRAWATPCDWCSGGAIGNRAPAWLAEPTAEQLLLTPIALGSSSWQALLPPALPLNPAWMGHWLEITGHFDDPAAVTCSWTPGPDELGWYDGRRSTIEGCRQRFVVTAVQIVQG